MLNCPLTALHHVRFRKIPLNSQPAKTLKSSTGGVSFCWIGMQYAMPYSPKCTPPNCFFLQFCQLGVSQNRDKKRINQDYLRCGKTIVKNLIWLALNGFDIFSSYNVYKQKQEVDQNKKNMNFSNLKNKSVCLFFIGNCWKILLTLKNKKPLEEETKI